LLIRRGIIGIEASFSRLSGLEAMLRSDMYLLGEVIQETMILGGCLFEAEAGIIGSECQVSIFRKQKPGHDHLYAW
jgi:hypothetical protein